MDHRRIEWTTFANINHYYDVCRDTYLEAKVAAKNPAWEVASQEDRDAGKVDVIIIEKPGTRCPLWST